MSDAPKIVVVGSTNTDIVVRTPRLPRPGETVLGSAMKRSFGGKGANQAVAAARLGAKVFFISCVGEDDFGREAIDHLENEGVETRYVFVDPTEPSGVALIGVEESTGENAIIVSSGANGCLRRDHIEVAGPAFESAAVVLCQMEVPPSAVEAALRLGIERGAVTILNPAPAAPLSRAIREMADFLTPNEYEASALAGMKGEPQRLARELCAMGSMAVIMTLGGRGALLAESGLCRLIPSFPVAQTVDTTAAGDCFNGALAVSLAEGRRIDDAVRFAHAAAALSVQSEGAQASLPRRAQVEEFLTQNGFVRQ